MGVRFPPGAPRPQTCHDAGTQACYAARMRRCTVCGDVKPLEQFFVKNTRSGRRHTRCKRCQQAYWRDYYHRSPHLRTWQTARTRRYRARNRDYIDEYLRNHPCVDCGISDPLVLEFDHVFGTKRAAVSTLVRYALPLQALADEIEKCEVRCANCHRRRTALSWPKRTRLATKPLKGYDATTDNVVAVPRGDCSSAG
jgi:hypothetical protein